MVTLGGVALRNHFNNPIPEIKTTVAEQLV